MVRRRASLESKLRALDAQISKLEAAALAAYEAGDLRRAESLDAKHWAALRRMEELGSEYVEPEVDWNMESREEEEVLRMLADRYHLFLQGRLPQVYSIDNTRSALADLLRMQLDYYRPLRPDVTNAQILEAAEDAHQRMTALRNRKKRRNPGWRTVRLPKRKKR